MIPVEYLPTLNALLNGTSTAFLVTGYLFIRRRNTAAHRLCMLAALLSSSLFLTSYLIYHYHVGSKPFLGPGWARTLYLVILVPHIVLAAGMVPFIIVLVIRAFRGQFDKHRRLARWTLPVWLYVSVTGVIIYLMLYHWFPSQ